MIIWEGNDGKEIGWKVMFWLIGGLIVGFVIVCLVIGALT